MAVTLVNLRDEVKALVVHLPAAMTDARIDLWIQRAQKDAEDRHGFLEMQSEEIFTTADATRVLGTLSVVDGSKWARRRERPYIVDGNGKTTLIDWIEDRAELQTIYNEESTTEKGSPKRVLLTTTQAKVYPLPNLNAPKGDVYSDGNWRVHLPYFKRLLLLDGDSDTNAFAENDRLRDWLVGYGAYRALRFNRDFEEAIATLQDATAALNKEIRHDKRLRMSSKIQQRPRSDVYAGSRQVSRR